MKLSNSSPNDFSDFCTESTVVKGTRIADVKTWPRDWESLKGNRS